MDTASFFWILLDPRIHEDPLHVSRYFDKQRDTRSSVTLWCTNLSVPWYAKILLILPTKYHLILRLERFLCRFVSTHVTVACRNDSNWSFQYRVNQYYLNLVMILNNFLTETSFDIFVNVSFFLKVYDVRFFRFI